MQKRSVPSVKNTLRHEINGVDTCVIQVDQKKLDTLSMLVVCFLNNAGWIHDTSYLLAYTLTSIMKKRMEESLEGFKTCKVHIGWSHTSFLAFTCENHEVEPALKKFLQVSHKFKICVCVFFFFFFLLDFIFWFHFFRARLSGAL
jgi:hypothetical protein